MMSRMSMLGSSTQIRPGPARNVVLWWDRAGGPLKVQTLGVRVELDNPVDAALGDLLIGACVDLALGPRAVTTP